MSHMVIYRGPDSKVGYHQTDDVHDAVGFVEQLRNDQGVEHARIFRLEEVNFEYRPYYRVELKSVPAIGSGASSPEVESIPEAPQPVVTPDPPAPEAKPVVENAVPEPAPEALKADVKDVKTEPVVEEVPVPPSPSSSDSGNGVGARRGLFGR